MWIDAEASEAEQLCQGDGQRQKMANVWFGRYRTLDIFGMNLLKQ